MYNAAVWLDTVKSEYNKDIDITWKHFQLDQVNDSHELELKNWAQWTPYQIRKSRSILAAIASESVRRNQPELFDIFHKTLLEQRHGSTGSRIPLNDQNKIVEIAVQLGLDEASLVGDLLDLSLIEVISQHHYEATETHGVFGTPTFVFENGNSVYLKTFIPPVGESVAFFDEFLSMMGSRSYIGELKRPQPPWPKGAIN